MSATTCLLCQYEQKVLFAAITVVHLEDAIVLQHEGCDLLVRKR